jgi:hypothetical protein
VRSGGELYVVADDELHLGRFAIHGNRPGALLRLFAGELPTRPRARKQRKADLEILLRLPPLRGHRHGALLALGSGSRKQRRRGALLGLDARGRARERVSMVDAAPLYERLERDFDELNLEGAWIDGDRLCLLQRGNQGGSPNAVLELDCRAVLRSLVGERVLPRLAPRRVTEMKLGRIGGVALGFTDACALSRGQWLFSAVAEDTDDAVADGAFVGAAIGLATREGGIAWLRRLAPGHKVEGIAAARAAGRLRLWCVTDADDARVPAQLLEASIDRW